MEIKTLDETTIRRFLLGQLSIEDMQEVELWLMMDDEAMDLVNAAEDDLIDESLAGGLKGNDLRQFESHFLTAPERQKKYQFSKVFHRRLRSNSKAKASESEKPARKSARTVIRSWFQFRLELGYAVPALVVILTTGALYHRTQLTSVRSETTTVRQERDGFESRLNAAQVDLEKQIAVNSKQGLTGTLTLTSGPVTRTNTTLKTIQVKSDSELIYFYMDLPDIPSQSYRAELYAIGKNEPIRTWNPISIVVDGPHRKARIIEAGVNLPTGELSLVIKEISASANSEPLSSRFAVVR